MTFGRPQAIPDSYVQLDLPVAYETAQTSVTAGPSPRSAGVDFYTATMSVPPTSPRICELTKVTTEHYAE